MSDLLKLYKALDEPELTQRIQGAVVQHANYVMADAAAPVRHKEFAAMALEDPTRFWQEMVIEVVSNGTVLANIRIDRHGTVDGFYVPDVDITYVVGFAWDKVAEKVLPPEPV